MGYLGVPTPALIVTIEGPVINYSLPAQSYPVKLTHSKPAFFISEEYNKPHRSVIISSKKELDETIHPSIYIQGVSFFRSYGFLVISTTSSRVYKLTIEKKTETGDRSQSETYCKMRYIGLHDGLPESNIQEIYDELQQFYSEFSSVMTKPIIIQEESPLSEALEEKTGEIAPAK
jgi:hypothetical protein